MATNGIAKSEGQARNDMSLLLAPMIKKLETSRINFDTQKSLEQTCRSYLADLERKFKEAAEQFSRHVSERIADIDLGRMFENMDKMQRSIQAAKKEQVYQIRMSDRALGRFKGAFSELSRVRWSGSGEPVVSIVQDRPFEVAVSHAGTQTIERDSSPSGADAERTRLTSPPQSHDHLVSPPAETADKVPVSTQNGPQPVSIEDAIEGPENVNVRASIRPEELAAHSPISNSLSSSPLDAEAKVEHSVPVSSVRQPNMVDIKMTPIDEYFPRTFRSSAPSGRQT